jgi:hypothetical protein
MGFVRSERGYKGFAHNTQRWPFAARAGIDAEFLILYQPSQAGPIHTIEGLSGRRRSLQEHCDTFPVNSSDTAGRPLRATGRAPEDIGRARSR